ncbi:MAG: DMT family transporter, partial [Pigmentiphaga sp.]
MLQAFNAVCAAVDAEADGMVEARLTGHLLLAMTVFGWGLGWPIIKLLLVYWPPLFARGVAGVIAGILILVVAMMRGEEQPIERRQWFWLFVCSLTNVFAWMGLPTIAMLWLSAGEGALLVYTFPIWVALFYCVIQRVRPARELLIAITLSVLGLVLLFDTPDMALTA